MALMDPVKGDGSSGETIWPEFPRFNQMVNAYS